MHNPLEVLCYARAASAAYLWGRDLDDALAAIDLDLVDSRDESSTDTQAFAARCGPVLVFGFRGTQGLADAVRDGEILPGPFGGKRLGGGSPLVHSGFRDAWFSVADWASSVSQRFAPSTQRVIVTGHSLGGAIATLAATDLWSMAPVEALTYGSPRVGHGSFAEAYRKAKIETTRVVHGPDLVPRVPVLPYEHVVDPLHLDDRGAVISRFGGWLRDVLRIGPRFIQDVDGAALDAHHVAAYVDACKGYAARQALPA